MKREPMYEVLYYELVNEDQSEDPIVKQFYTKKQALAFYNKHKNDNDKSGWWITHRNKDWEVIEDIVY